MREVVGVDHASYHCEGGRSAYAILYGGVDVRVEGNVPDSLCARDSDEWFLWSAHVPVTGGVCPPSASDDEAVVFVGPVHEVANRSCHVEFVESSPVAAMGS